MKYESAQESDDFFFASNLTLNFSKTLENWN